MPLNAAAVYDAWTQHPSAYNPSWEQGHGPADEDFLTWDTTIEPRETLWVAITSRGSLSARGAGEAISMIFPQACWVMVHMPAEADYRTAAIGAPAVMSLRFEQAIGGGWSSRLRPRAGIAASSTRANREHPPDPSNIYPAEEAPIAAGEGEDHRLNMRAWVHNRQHVVRK